jgi:hypothetical protein
MLDNETALNFLRFIIQLLLMKAQSDNWGSSGVEESSIQKKLS